MSEAGAGGAVFVVSNGACSPRPGRAAAPEVYHESALDYGSSSELRGIHEIPSLIKSSRLTGVAGEPRLQVDRDSEW